MAQINFYALSDSAFDNEDARLALVCRIVEKAAKLGHRIYIYTATEAQSRQLDNLLWEFKAASFLPHEISAQTEQHKICINHHEPSQQFDDAVINLNPNAIENPQRLKSLNELVGPDQRSLQAGREHFRAYKTTGLDIDTHKL